MTYAKRTDVNHRDIVDSLRRVPGVYVQDVASCASLGFDIIVRYQDRPPVFMEIKRDPKARMTISEQKARKLYEPYWHRVHTFEDALRAVGIDVDGPPLPEGW